MGQSFHLIGSAFCQCFRSICQAGWKRADLDERAQGEDGLTA